MLCVHRVETVMLCLSILGKILPVAHLNRVFQSCHPYKNTITYRHYDFDDKTNVSAAVATLLNFTRMFRKAHEENVKQAEFERKKALKEAELEKAAQQNAAAAAAAAGVS